MSTINNSPVSTKDNLITSSATGLLAGAGFALAGYNSRPYIKEGVISDAFVRNVEGHLVNKFPGGSENKKLLESFNSFIDEIGKATSYSKMAEANYNFYNKISPDKSFKGVKEIIKQSLITMMDVIAEPNAYITDVMLDYYNAIDKAKNSKDIKNAICYYFEDFGAQFNTFQEVQASLKESFRANKNSLLGLDPDISLKDAIESSFDWRGEKFVQKPNSGISKDLFNAISDAAQSMQRKTAVKWGGIAAAIFGGAMFLLQKFSSPKSKPIKVSSQPQIYTQSKAQSQAQMQPQQPQVKPEVQTSYQAQVQTQSLSQEAPKPQSQVLPQEKVAEKTQSTNLLQNYKENKN